MTKTSIMLKDQSAPNMVVFLEEELSKLKKETEIAPFTSGKLEIAPGTVLNIFEETNRTKIKDAIALVIAREEYSTKAIEILGGEYPVFTISGYESKHWISDSKTRLSYLKSENRRKELEDLKTEAAKFMTVEDQKSLFLDRVAKALGK